MANPMLFLQSTRYLPNNMNGTSLLDDEAVRVAVVLCLEARLCEPDQCPCGAKVVPEGTHGLACRRSAGRTSCLHTINDLVWRALHCKNLVIWITIRRVSKYQKWGFDVYFTARGVSKRQIDKLEFQTSWTTVFGVSNHQYTRVVFWNTYGCFETPEGFKTPLWCFETPAGGLKHLRVIWNT